MRNELTLTECKSYVSEANLRKALARLGLHAYRQEAGQVPCRYIVCRTPKGRWTAVFLVTEFFSINETGGYVGFAAHHGFMSV